MGVTVHKNSLENCHLLTKSGFSRKKVDYFDGNLLNKKMVVTKKLTKSRLLTILQVTKSGFFILYSLFIYKEQQNAGVHMTYTPKRGSMVLETR